jgi:hypothetical protein
LPDIKKCNTLLDGLSRVNCQKIFTFEGYSGWDIELENSKTYDMYLESIVVPIYPKIRLSFKEIYKKYSNIVLTRFNEENKYNLEKDIFLIESNKYKSILVNSKPSLDINYVKFKKGKIIDNKADLLLSPLPKYIWVIRLMIDKEIVMDIIFDSTARYSAYLAFIIYDNLKKYPAEYIFNFISYIKSLI